MIRQEQQTLWDGIRQFAIDDPGAVVKYSDKLQQSCHWTSPYTSRVIEEYRKFIFLCMVLPRGASPSHDVDEAWHMHLTYTVNYWSGLCDKVLGKPLHHHPSRGGPEEKDKHVNWYRETLEGYRYYFGEDPPRDIWPPPPVPVQQHNTETPKTNSPTYLLLLPLPFVIPLFYHKQQPFELSGPQFLIFFITLLFCSGCYLYNRYHQFFRTIQQQFQKIDTRMLNLYQFTRSVFGHRSMLQTAAVDLVTKGIIKPAIGKHFSVEAVELIEQEDKNPLAGNLQKNHTNGDSLSMNDLEYLDDITKSMHLETEERMTSLRGKDMPAIGVMILVLLIGLCRIVQGLDNHRPVLYLVLLEITAMVALIIVAKEFSGRHLLRKMATAGYQQNSLSLSDKFSNTSAFEYAFFGFTAIAGMYGAGRLQDIFYDYEHPNLTRFNNATGANSSCGGSGCGSSDSGSSCGGGGCGGGCGGCGG